MVVGGALPFLWALHRVAWRTRAIQMVSGLALVIGSAVFVHRAFL